MVPQPISSASLEGDDLVDRDREYRELLVRELEQVIGGWPSRYLAEKLDATARPEDFPAGGLYAPLVALEERIRALVAPLGERPLDLAIDALDEYLDALSDHDAMDPRAHLALAESFAERLRTPPPASDTRARAIPRGDGEPPASRYAAADLPAEEIDLAPSSVRAVGAPSARPSSGVSGRYSSIPPRRE